MYQKERRGSWIFLDNSVMSYSCESVDSFPRIYRDSRNVKVTGSPINEFVSAIYGFINPFAKKIRGIGSKVLGRVSSPARKECLMYERGSLL